MKQKTRKMTVTARIPENVALLIAGHDPQHLVEVGLGAMLGCFAEDEWPEDAARYGVTRRNADKAFRGCKVEIENAEDGEA